MRWGLKPIHWLIVLGSVLFLWLWIFGNQGLYELRQLSTIKQSLQKETLNLQKEKENLTTESKRLEEPEYMEHVIRQELGYVKPSEKVVQFTKPSVEPKK